MDQKKNLVNPKIQESEKIGSIVFYFLLNISLNWFWQIDESRGKTKELVEFTEFIKNLDGQMEPHERIELGRSEKTLKFLSTLS